MLSLGLSLWSSTILGAGANEPASVVTWDSATDTYTQFVYAENASVVTWDSAADTYTQSLFGA